MIALDCNLTVGAESAVVGSFTDRNLVVGKGLLAESSVVRVTFMSIGVVAHCTSEVIFVFFGQVQINAFHRAF